MNRAARTCLAERARYMRKNMTEAEKILWFRFLREYPIRFSNQIIVGPYIVDFYCRKVRLSIELDGSQHYEEVHRNTTRYELLTWKWKASKSSVSQTRTFGIISKVFAR
ncbi:MAG: DUF559 domain-containing protein [Gordonibacter pamelaeae]